MKTEKNRKMKGSVLLTVVSVMALLIIFMMAAVTLSNSMNNRAHANYSDSQAEYTAKAAIQSFTQALQDNDAVAQTVVSMDIGDVVTPAVVVSDKGMGSVGYYDKATGDWVTDRIKIEYVKDNIAYDKAQDAWVPMQVIKITATAKVGKQEKSISYYIERAASESKSSSIKGFQTLGGGGHQNNGEITGALTMGLEQNGKLEYGFNNDYNLRTDTMFVNGHFTKTNGDNVYFNVVKPSTQYVVMGDFTVQGSKFEINIDYPYGSSSANGTLSSENMTQQNIPYLYVKGNLGSSTGMTTLNVNAVGADNVHELKSYAPFNIFCGTIGGNTSANLPGVDPATARMKQASSGTWGGLNLNGADIYLMNDLSDPSHDSYLNPARTSNLYKWSSSVLNGTSSQNFSEGGSIYCNHNLHIGQPLHVGGNLVVQGDLILNATVDVDGDLVVKGNISDTSKIGTVGGTIYYGTSAGTNIYIAHNTPTDGDLKPDVVKVENYETGNIYIENKVVANIPVYGDFVSEENDIIEGYEELTLSNSNATGWRWQDEAGNIDIVAQLGFSDDGDFSNNGVNAWINNQTIKPHLSIQDNYDGAGGRKITILVKYDEDGNIDDYKPAMTYVDRLGNETYDQISYYYVDGDEYTVADPTDVHTELYVADKDGNPTSETTYDLTTTYVVNYRGEVTDETTTEEGTYYVADERGNATNIIATKFSYFYKVDPSTSEATDQLADSRFSYYHKRPDDSYEEISEAEAYGPSAGFYKAWYDESELVSEEYFYYTADPSGHTGFAWHDANQASAADLVSGGNNVVASYPGYHNGSVYPASMTNEEITVGEQKIVMSLKEARDNIGMKSDGTFPEGLYTVNFDSETVGFKEADHTYTDPDGNSETDYIITKSGTITGGWNKKAIRIKPKDASDVINIVLKDVDIRNGAAIVVDGKGIVNILFEGTVQFNASNSGIYTADIYDRIKKDGNNAKITIKESDKLNIIMYGKEGSTISCNNTAVFCGIAKCPYTSFKNPATQGLTAKWKYIMNTGQIWEPSTVNWVGSALFKDAETNDNFTLLYTNSADGGDSISNEGVDGANWYGKYYDAY